MGRVEAMADGIAEAVRGGMAHGETRVHVSVAREVAHDDGTVSTEFFLVEGFACASVECSLPFHVRVYAAEPRYEYPQHLAHRDEH